MGIPRSFRSDKVRENLRKLLRELCIFSEDHRTHALQLRSLLGHRLAAVAGNQNVDGLAHLEDGRQRMRRCRTQIHIVMISNQKRSHSFVPSNP